MKKTILAVLIAVFALGGVCHAVELTDEDYKDMDRLRSKLVRMKTMMDTLMKEVVSASPYDYASGGTFGENVKVDITEDEKNITVKADLPGMGKDRIDITLEKSKILKISGTREVVKKEASPGVVRQEREYGKFQRALELPCECKEEGIKATYKDGVLEIVIPKKEPSKKDSVKIKVD